MKVQTYSIIVGTRACNARCPYCVSKMTPNQGIEFSEQKINWRNFDIGAQLARESGAYTAMLTGKGEPLLYPDQISAFVKRSHDTHKFPLIEIQTNGILLSEKTEKYDAYLKEWYNNGLTTIAISVAHYEANRNKEIFTPHKDNYMNLPGVIEKLHDIGYSVRLSAVLLDGYIDKPSEIENLVNFAKENKVEQLSVRPVRMPITSIDDATKSWAKNHELKDNQLEVIAKYISSESKELMKLSHGATVYDFRGQNLCLTDALTLEPSTDDIRQLIFFPDGHVRYDWQYVGAVIL